MGFGNYHLSVVSVILIALVVVASVHSLIAFPLYQMYVKANLNNAWLAFVPVIGTYKMFHLANLSGVYFFLASLIVVGINLLGRRDIAQGLSFIFTAWCTIKVFLNFDIGIFGCILGVIAPGLVMWYILLEDKEFITILDSKFVSF